MNSFNHYAYGAVYDWIFTTVAGIHVTEEGAGYRHVRIQPYTDRRFGGFVQASVETAYGLLSSAWYEEAHQIRFEFEIPEGTSAELLLPDGRRTFLTAGNHVCYCQM